MKALAWVLGLVVAVTAIATVVANLERPGPLVTRPQPAGPRALVVFQPGLSSFPADVAHAFAEGLGENGWAVDLGPLSSEGPHDVARYQLVAVVSPTYWWSIAVPVRRYLDRVGGLDGRRVVAITTGAGHADRSLRILAEQLERRGATVVARGRYFTSAPNDEAHYVAKENRAVGLGLARGLGRSVAKEGTSR